MGRDDGGGSRAVEKPSASPCYLKNFPLTRWSAGASSAYTLSGVSRAMPCTSRTPSAARHRPQDSPCFDRPRHSRIPLAIGDHLLIDELVSVMGVYGGRPRSLEKRLYGSTVRWRADAWQRARPGTVRADLIVSCDLRSVWPCRLERAALYAIQVFGTFPPLAASWRMTSLWSQTFILDEPFVFPE